MGKSFFQLCLLPLTLDFYIIAKKGKRQFKLRYSGGIRRYFILRKIYCQTASTR